MSHIVDDDPPIKTGVTSKAYRENWDRVFGEGAPEPDSDAIECVLKSHANLIVPLHASFPAREIEIGWTCPCCHAYPVNTQNVI